MCYILAFCLYNTHIYWIKCSQTYPYLKVLFGVKGIKQAQQNTHIHNHPWESCFSENCVNFKLLLSDLFQCMFTVPNPLYIALACMEPFTWKIFIINTVPFTILGCKQYLYNVSLKWKKTCKKVNKRQGNWNSFKRLVVLTTQLLQLFISRNSTNETFSFDRQLLPTEPDLRKIIIAVKIQMKGVTRIFVV